MAIAEPRRGRRPLPPVPELDTSLLEGEEAARSSARETYWTLVWRKFRRHRLAMVGAVIVLGFYVTCFVFGDFVAPYTLEYQHRVFKAAPPQRLHFVDALGEFHLRPFVYGYRRELDPVTFERKYTEDRSKPYPLHFLVRGDSYRFLGLFSTNLHLFGVNEGGTAFLFGTDRLGRDMFSRVLYGGRVSLTVGLLGMFMQLTLGVVLGSVSGFYGGRVDNVIQRLVEFLAKVPHVAMWMALAAALPPQWSPLAVYFMITLILAFLGWGGLARAIRGLVLSLRERDFVLAAQGLGASDRRLILRHLVPNTSSHIIVSCTNEIPRMILNETTLSFLGLGLRPPMTSWGVLMNESSEVRVLAEQPWLILPAVFVIAVVLAFNFMGDGLRDASDPYSR